MALDPKFRAILDLPGMQLGAPPPEVTPAMMREGARALLPPVEPLPLHEVRDVEFDGPASKLRVRLYYPTAGRPLPLVAFFHGGGFVLCDLDSHDATCRQLAARSGCAVAAVDYRLAPETRFPGPLEDCYAALVWLVREAAALGFDASRVAVCGDSAGANLATAVAMLARDRRGPALRHQALICPALDAACDAPSMRELANGYMLSADLMRWFWQQYLGQPEDARSPLASPSCATDLAGLPPATIVTAELDPLRDEGELYGDRLRAAGVPATTRRYAGMIHDFPQMPLVTEVANQALGDVAADLRAALSGPSAAPDDAARAALVKRLYGAVLSDDFAAAEALVTDDFTIVEAADLPFGGSYTGKDAFQQLFAKVGPLLAIRGVAMKHYLADAEGVAVVVDLTVEHDGRHEVLQIVELVSFRGEKVCRLQPFYFDTAKVHACAKRAG